jgi:hypothetical protein
MLEIQEPFARQFPEGDTTAAALLEVALKLGLRGVVLVDELEQPGIRLRLRQCARRRASAARSPPAAAIGLNPRRSEAAGYLPTVAPPLAIPVRTASADPHKRS